LPSGRIGIILDGFDTTICCPWTDIRNEIARAIGIDGELLREAFNLTQGARNVGAFPTPDSEMAEIFRALGIQACSAKYTRLYKSLILDRADLYYDVAEFLDACCQAGIPTMILSNCGPLSEAAFSVGNVNKLVDRLVLSYRIGYRKPDIHSYIHARSGFGTDRNVVFVDDNPLFCEGAKEAGLESIQITRSASDQRYDKSPLVTQISSLATVADAFIR
jgi:FMN phosphatase YigB (HAD superfamily)